MAAGAVTTGAWFPGPTTIVVVEEPVTPFDAWKDTMKVPAWSAPGVQAKAPVVFDASTVNVAPAGSDDAVRETIVPPSGSLAVTAKEIGTPVVPVTDAGESTIGGRAS